VAGKRRILITNDDGYYSDGINALFEELSRTRTTCYMVATRPRAVGVVAFADPEPLHFGIASDRQAHYYHRRHSDRLRDACAPPGLQGTAPGFHRVGINHGANRANVTILRHGGGGDRGRQF